MTSYLEEARRTRAQQAQGRREFYAYARLYGGALDSRARLWAAGPPTRDDTPLGVALRLRDEHTQEEAVERVRGFEGAYWDGVRLELFRFLLDTSEVWDVPDSIKPFAP
ncbi:MAG: hypothetical protein KAT70_08090 [Thermoplasmata archaeon]|nr:hypothetical protein [Thermoplasmata archaeon]